jgi:hypothetical protein
MKINATPFFTASGFGIIFQLLITGIATVVSGLMLPGVSNDALGSTGQDISNFYALTSIISCLTTIINYAGYILIGVVYSIFQQRSDAPDIGEGAIGGAASAMVVSVVGTVVRALAELLIEWVRLSSLVQSVPGGEVFGMLALGSIVGLISSLCMGLLFSGVLGALGGGITSAIYSSRAHRAELTAL